jgi:catechol 2,3-dioxygenase-like lactoylglutathione lyase family enzyme
MAHANDARGGNAGAQTCLVGGVALERPFHIRRLGHFGMDVADVEASRAFYTQNFGFRVADPIDFGPRLPAEERANFPQTTGYFMRHGADHHSLVIFPRPLRMRLLPHYNTRTTINQITWQVGSLREVVDGFAWLGERGVKIARSGRDNPGSNWHAYPLDPDGHTNEIYYGIEQIGWDQLSKPKGMHRRDYHTTPTLPHRSEYAEVMEGYAQGVDVTTGTRGEESLPEACEVGGVLLGRPFKVTKIGPVRIFVEDVDASAAFYMRDMGLRLTEEVVWNGHRCLFLRANNEHHSLALYPLALRAELGLKAETTLFSIGMQVSDYQQLKDALAFLAQRKTQIRKLPPELFPSVDYTAFAVDPDGHLVQLYYYMETIGWDGRPRPAAARPKIDNDAWPEYVEAQSDAFCGETFMGPWS